MAVTQVNRLDEASAGPMIGADTTRTYQETWEAISDTIDESGITVLAHPSLPRLFVTRHRFDSTAVAVGVKPQKEQEYWTLEYTYSTKVPEFAQGKPDGSNQANPTNPDNPFDQKPRISVGTMMVKVHTLVDLDGEDFVNAAGSPYETAMREVELSVIEVERNLPVVDYTLWKLCKGAVNGSAFLGYYKRQVWCADLSLRGDWNHDTFYWVGRGKFVVGNDDQIPARAKNPKTGADLTINDDGPWWFDFRLNAGFDELVSGQRRPILIRGQRPAHPVPLNLFGEKLAVGVDPIYFGYRVRRDAGLGALGLFD